MISSITYKFLIANAFNVACIIFPAVLQLVLVVTYWLVITPEDSLRVRCTSMFMQAQPFQ